MEIRTENKTARCGMFVNPECPYLAASPDALLGTDEVVEVKCPYTARDRVISVVSVPYLKHVDGRLTLDEGHAYYYQVQGQLYCTGRQKCTFVVYTLKDMKCILIQRDEDFIGKMLTKLQSFYDNYFKGAILDRFYFKDYYRYSFDMSQ